MLELERSGSCRQLSGVPLPSKALVSNWDAVPPTPDGTSQSTRVVQPDSGVNRWLVQLAFSNAFDTCFCVFFSQEANNLMVFDFDFWAGWEIYLTYCSASLLLSTARHTTISLTVFPLFLPLETPSLPP